MQHVTGFDRVADVHGFVVAYLGSTSSVHAWWTSYDPNYLSYINSIIGQLEANQNIDPTRVYATGFSAGGLPAFRSACELGGKVAAIAVVGDVVGPHRCNSIPQPVSELTIVGTSDAVPVSGPISATATTRRFLALDRCSAGSQSSRVGPVTQQIWTSCNDGSAVGLYVLAGGQHLWPYLRTPVVAAAGNPDAQYGASQAIWSFLSARRSLGFAASAHLSTLRLQYPRHAEQVVVASFRLHEHPIIVSATVGRAGRQLTTKRARLSHGLNVALSLALPRMATAGRYWVAFALKDSYGRHLQFVRTIGLTG
jgi:dienelactone hydrolase